MKKIELVVEKVLKIIFKQRQDKYERQFSNEKIQIEGVLYDKQVNGKITIGNSQIVLFYIVLDANYIIRI